MLKLFFSVLLVLLVVSFFENRKEDEKWKSFYKVY